MTPSDPAALARAFIADEQAGSAKPSFWTKRGSLQLEADDIRPVGLGELLARLGDDAQELGDHVIKAIVPALVAGRALAVGVCEYAGRIEFGFTADRGVIDDLALIRDYVRESYEELADAH